MGLLSFAESMGLLLIGLEWIAHPAHALFAIDKQILQTMVFLQLAVGGHLLLFVVRTRHSVFVPPYPSLPLFGAIVATQIAAILICCLRHSGAETVLAGDRRGLDLFARLDGGARYREAALSSVCRRDAKSMRAALLSPLRT